MTEELANLLIRVSSVGFDEVLKSLRELEQAAKAVSSGGGLVKLQDTLDKISTDLDELKDGMSKATNGFTAFGNKAKDAGQKVDQTTKALQKNQELMATLAKAYASFWVMFNAPRKFFATLDGIAKFNTQLKSMSVTAQMSRGALMALGQASEVYGGSTQSMAALAARAQRAMQNFRMGKGGGEFEEAAAMYGLDIAGTGEGGLATTGEMVRNIAAALEALPDEDSKLGLKSLLGLSDADYQVLKQGVKAYDEILKKEKENEERLKEADRHTEEWNRATAELAKEWEILKTQVFVQLAPYIKKIVELVGDIVRRSGEFKGVLAAIYAAAVAIGTAIAAWKFAQAVGAAVKLLGVLKSIKSLGSVGGGIAGGAGGGSPIGGGAGVVAAHPAAIIASVAGAVANVVQNQLQIHSLSVMEQHLAAWHNEWRAFTLYSNTGILDKDGDGYSLSKEAFGRLLPGFNADVVAMWQVAASNARRMKGYEYAVTENEYERRRGGASSAKAEGSSAKVINVTMHIGTVESAAENYDGFVKELLGNAKDVVAQRLETADWFDSNSGVIVA